MDPIKFTDPEVASRFEALTDKDRRVEMPGVYAGLFSKIPRVVATRMVRQGCDNLIKAKDGVKDEDPAAAIPPAKQSAPPAIKDAAKAKGE